MKIGIDIGGSHIGTGIVLEKGNLIGKETRDLEITKIGNEKRVEDLIIETIDNEIKILLERYDYSIGDISKIGIAVPGSPKDNIIQNLVNLNIKKFNIGKILEEKYNTKIKVKNDGKCAGIAEKEYGSLKNYKDCVFLCIGTGVGSAVFLDDQLLEPIQNPGFEFGHMIIEKNGNQCNCGNKGCFETYASMKRFKTKAIEILKLEKDCESEELQNYIRKNIENQKVKNLVNEYIENIAMGVSNIVNIFEPQAISFGGSFSYYEDIFLPILDERVKAYKFNKETKVKLLSAKLKNDAGIIGATEI